MQELRLVGVQEDGGHLLLSNEDGEEFSLPVTEALRAAATRPIGRPSARAADAAEGVLTPRDIQARIRAGATAEQVAAASGVDLERVRKYEGPVLAERDWIAHQARQVEVAAPLPGHDLYRSTFGDEPALLGDMVRHRLAALGMDATSAHWDAWRLDDGSWTVSLDFSTEGTDTAIGDRPPALWSFRPSSHHLHNQNRWAQVLSELDPLDGPFGSRRLAAVGDRPFNVEEDEETSEASSVSGPRGPRPAVDQESQDELLDVLRARRGQRLGVDEEGDDELALMLTRDEAPSPEAARPRLTVASAPDARDDAGQGAGGDTADGGPAHGDESDDGPGDQPGDGAVTGDDDVASPESDDSPDDAGSDGWGGRAAREERDGDGAASDAATGPGEASVDIEDDTDDRRHGEDTDEDTAGDDVDTDGPGPAGRTATPGRPATDKGRSGASARKGQSRQSSSRSKRPSVPSWDEIVFGRKND